MDRNFRRTTLAHILKTAGVVSDIVEKTLGASPNNTGFKDAFLKMPPGAARENLVYNEIIKRGPPKQLVPITIEGPNGIKITYRVMPDYVMIDGVRATMAPATAQRVADYFNMKLPTDKMSQQIYHAADTKVRAAPLSGSGYVGADGRQYSGKDVAERRIGQADAALHYNQLTDQEIEKQKNLTGKTPELIAGHGKDILQPTGDPNDPRIGGWQGSQGDALQPYSIAHRGEAGTHTEYGLYTRLVDNQVTVTTPDGQTINTTMDKLLTSPTFSGAVTTTPGIKKYKI